MEIENPANVKERGKESSMLGNERSEGVQRRMKTTLLRGAKTMKCMKTLQSCDDDEEMHHE